MLTELNYKTASTPEDNKALETIYKNKHNNQSDNTDLDKLKYAAAKMTMDCFNKTPYVVDVDEFYASEYYTVLTKHPLRLTEWKNYSEAELANDENKQFIGGYLKRYTYKEACQIWWEQYTTTEKAIIMSIPNFDKEKFEYITRNDVTKDKNRRKE